MPPALLGQVFQCCHLPLLQLALLFLVLREPPSKVLIHPSAWIITGAGGGVVESWEEKAVCPLPSEQLSVFVGDLRLDPFAEGTGRDREVCLLDTQAGRGAGSRGPETPALKIPRHVSSRSLIEVTFIDREALGAGVGFVDCRASVGAKVQDKEDEQRGADTELIKDKTA